MTQNTEHQRAGRPNLQQKRDCVMNAEQAINAEIQRQEQELQRLREELAEETEAAENWRRLALQFDNHRLQAIGHLKAVTNPAACFDKYKAAKAFLSAPPLGGEEVLAQRIAALAIQTKQGERP